jgi:hypothetical protein
MMTVKLKQGINFMKRTEALLQSAFEGTILDLLVN